MKWDIEGVVINKKLFPCSTPTEVEKSATSSGADNTVTFTTNERKPLTSLDITIEPSQEGSGDPSPDNVRPLVSYDKVTAKLQKGTTKVKEVVSFGSTVYGLTGDCVTGEFEETYGVVDLGSLGWDYYRGETEPYFRVLNFGTNYNPKLPPNSSTVANLFCSIFKAGKSGSTGTSGSLQNHNYEISLNPTGRLFIIDSDYTDATDLIRDLSGVYLVFELATPSELTTTPLVITTFAGEQTIKFDEKIPFTMKYLTLEGDSCDKAKQFLPLFYNKERRSL